MTRRPRWLSLLALLVVSSTPVACGGDTESERASAGGDAADPGGSPDGVEDGALYAMTLNVSAPLQEDEVNYLVSASDLEEGTVLSPDRGFEGVGFAAYGVDGHPAVWVEGVDSPTLERWDLMGGEFMPPTLVRTISFANLGSENVNPFWGTLVSPELGVVPYNRGAELVRWNPSTMELLGTVPLDDSELQQTTRMRMRPDGTILASGTRYSYDEALAEWDFDAPLGFAAIFLDADATGVIRQDSWDEARQGNAVNGFAADGTAYFGLFPGDVEGQQFCLLRVLPDTTQFDRDFGCKPLVDLVEGAGARELYSWPDAVAVLGSRAVFMLFRFDEELGDVVEGLYSWDLVSERAERLETQGIEPWGTFLRVDGRLFVHVTRSTSALEQCVSEGESEQLIVDAACVDAAHESGTPFYEITNDGAKPAFTIAAAAQVSNIVRVR